MNWMNQKVVIILSLIVFLGLVGTSYGYWTTGVQLDGTVSIGTFGVELQPDSVRFVPKDSSGGFHQVEIDVQDNTIYLRGSVPHVLNGKLEFTVKNKGTTPVTLDEITVEPGESITLYQRITIDTKIMEIEFKKGEWVDWVIIDAYLQTHKPNNHLEEQIEVIEEADIEEETDIDEEIEEDESL